MIKKTTSGFVAAAVMAMTGNAAFADGHGEITVGYFLEWPMPFLAAKASGAYDEALGMKVNWVSFETGTAMSAAMASGDVQISVSQGVPPFVVATSLQVVDMAPPEGAAALSQGAGDFACGWGGGLARMKEYGNILLTGAEKQELGILVFDVTSAPASYIAENGDVMAKFVKVTADANAEWAANQSDEMLAAIAKESGMDVDATKASISTFEFPTIEEQLSSAWFGGNAAPFMKGVADVFVGAGSIDSALDSYAGTVNTGPLEAAKGM